MYKYTELKLISRAGTIQYLSVHYRYINQPIRIDTVIVLYNLENQLGISSWYKLCWTNTLWIQLWYTMHKCLFCFSTSIGLIHCKYQPKTFTLLLKPQVMYMFIVSKAYCFGRSVLNTYRYGYWPYRPSPTDKAVMRHTNKNCDTQQTIEIKHYNTSQKRESR